MTIRQLPPAPSRDRPNEFSGEMDAFLASMQGFADDANALEQAMELVATTGTSTSTLTVGMGSKALATQAGKAWATGAWVYVFAAAAVSNYMVGRVTSYDAVTGALVVNVSAIDGSGSHSSWIIGLATPVADGHLVARDGSRAMTAELLLSGNAVNALGAVPKQQAESIAEAAVSNRMQYSRHTGITATSVTSVAMPAVPSWAKRITITPFRVSTSGTSGIKIRAVTASGVVVTGYECTTAYIASGSNVAQTTDRLFDTGSSAATLSSGDIVITNQEGNRWVQRSTLCRFSDAAVQTGAGGIELPQALIGLEMTTANNSDTFDGGWFSVLFEG